MDNSERAAVVDRFLDKMGIDMKMQSDPHIMQDILQTDMLLGELASARACLGDSLVQSVSFGPMLATIRAAVIEKHPAIIEFLEQVLNAGLIQKVSHATARDVVKRLVHHTYILEALTQEMVQRIRFTEELFSHFSKVRNQLGIRSNLVDGMEDLVRIYGSYFYPTKLLGVDITCMAKLKIRMRGNLTTEDTSTDRTLRMNVLEAVITETCSPDNALAGLALAEIEPSAISLSEEHKIFRYHLSDAWSSLYETWNFAFLTGNLSYLELLYPKLLIPSVIAANSNEYLFCRLQSLWLSLHFHLAATQRHRSTYLLPGAQELAQLWGQINCKYATKLVRAEKNIDLQSLAPLGQITMQELMMRIIKKLNHSAQLSQEEVARLSAIYEPSNYR